MNPTQVSAATRTRAAVAWRWTKRIAIGAAALLVVVPLAGLAYQSVASALDARRFPPPGRLVDVGGHRLHVHTQGDASPTVVLDAGLSGCSLSWSLVQPEVARFARVCAYDRAGHGWSDPAESPRTSLQIARELRTLLTNVRIPGPYVLVGHSFGGFNVRVFASEYPLDVAGLVLVDASLESERVPASVSRAVSALREQARAARVLSWFGIVRAFFIEPNAMLPASARDAEMAVNSRTRYLDTVVSEWDLMETESVAQVRSRPSLPPVPIVVLAAERSMAKPLPGVSQADTDRANLWSREDQAAFAHRYPTALHIAVDSSHEIPQDQPAAVVDAIRKVVEAVRENRPLRR